VDRELSEWPVDCLAAISVELRRVAGALVGAGGGACLPAWTDESEISGVTRDGSSLAGLFSVALLSRECVAAGVSGGDCMTDTCGEPGGEVVVEMVLSRELT
jgi:hypothetical protein